jgi:hypothetical protein
MHRRFRGPAALLVPLLLAACGDGPVAPDTVTAAQVNGVWHLAFARSPEGAQAGCLAPGTLSITADVQQATGQTASTWSNDVAVPDRWPMTGTVTLRTGVATLHLWTRPNEGGWRLSGSFTRYGQFTGWLLDPAPGARPYHGAGCIYTVTGTRP